MKLFLCGGGSGKQIKYALNKFSSSLNKDKPILYIPLAMDEDKYDSCKKWFTSEMKMIGIDKFDMVRSSKELSEKDFKKSEEEKSNKKAGQINKINTIDNKSSQSNRNTSNSEQKENEFGKSSDSRNNNSKVATDGKDKKNRIGCISCKGESCIIY